MILLITFLVLVHVQILFNSINNHYLTIILIDKLQIIYMFQVPRAMSLERFPKVYETDLHVLRFFGLIWKRSILFFYLLGPTKQLEFQNWFFWMRWQFAGLISFKFWTRRLSTFQTSISSLAAREAFDSRYTYMQYIFFTYMQYMNV